MRTTVTLDPDVEVHLRKLMRDRDLSFKEALNESIRLGLRRPARTARFKQTTFHMGKPEISLDKALALAAGMEDEELIRKLAMRK